MSENKANGKIDGEGLFLFGFSVYREKRKPPIFIVILYGSLSVQLLAWAVVSFPDIAAFTLIFAT